ncbi:chemotaxis protein CheW [Rhodobacteraceae bacterium 2CG4]|uniref:Chemotaxis protein CheW n=1 Tax=Halovulum marinum TaxID=2662447 RepID=A0A6L5YZ19_9RHOB|nr:chemotaxis protein CheW [Halovulum marinum]MSU89458.1 chemotaxis protein CheW [Halovulum marinum]
MTAIPNPEARAELRQFVTFRAAGGAYGVPITSVREIRQWAPVTALPDQPAHTFGLLNLRGTIVPVHDLRVRFGAPRVEPTPEHVVVIVWIGGRTVGVIVDSVSDILAIPGNRIRPVPMAPAGGVAAMVSGLVPAAGGEMVALLDLEAVFPECTDPGP